jgi:predicted nucleotidyltransferase
MARTVGQAFDVFLKRLTPTAAQREAGASHRVSVKAALEARLEVSRFLETGSFSHGTGVRNHSDIDLLVSLKEGKPTSSYSALERVKNALSSRFPSTPVRIRRPAVAVEFGGGYETWEVIPGYITGRGGRALVYDVPSPKVGGAWIDSAPDEHLTYVNEANKKPDKGDAKALARLMKAWKYYRNVPVSSFYLEMQAARYVKGINAYIHVWDLCLLLERLHGNELAAMNDPSNASGRIRACSSDSTRADALSKLKRAASRARKALDAYKGDDEADAFYYLDLLFNGKFPSRD